MLVIKTMVITLVAIILLLIGLVFSVTTPIPLGFPLILFAIVLLLTSNRTAAQMMVCCRRRIGLLDRWVNWLEVKGGDRFGRVLRKTRPGRVPKRV